MNPLLLGTLLEWGGKLLERLFPDPSAKAAAEMEMLRALQEADMKVILAQLEVNAKEAQHASIFVSGWRPWIGWICGASFLYSTILHPLLTWYGRARGWPAPPTLDADMMMYVLGGMLGLGGYRTVEKIKGATK